MAPRERSVSCIWPALCGVKLGFNLRKDGAVLGISLNILICSVKLKQPISHEAVLDVYLVMPADLMCPLLQRNTGISSSSP